MSSKRFVMILILFVFVCSSIFAEENQVRGDTNPSFSLVHRVAVDASLSYKFTNPQGATISSKNLEIGTTNNVGGLYASFNTTRKINLQLVWTPLLKEGESVASADTAYSYTMTLTNYSGNVLPDYASPEAAVAASASEFVVYGDYGAGEAYFLNKWLNKTSSQLIETSLICGISISIAVNDELPPGTYTGSIYFITLGD